MKKFWAFRSGLCWIAGLSWAATVGPLGWLGAEPQKSLVCALGKNPLVKRVEILTPDGGRVDWPAKGEFIAFDREGGDGSSDVWLMKPDGSGQKCLTCVDPRFPKNNGQPAWDPSGEYLVFQAQNPNLRGLPGKALERLEDSMTGPGVGVNNNLWLANVSRGQFWRLTDIADQMATLHSHFSNGGRKLLWSERTDRLPRPVGRWEMKIGDIILGDKPRLTNVRPLRPGNMLFYETHGFSPDDRKIIFSATPDGYFQNFDIYVYDLSSEKIQALTDSRLREWDEHAHFSPDGRKIVWMSSTGIPQTIGQYNVITDYWLMNADGSDKVRLTYFNDPGAPEFLKIPQGVTVGDCSWSPDGRKIAAYVINRSNRKGLVVLIELDF